MAEGGFFWYSAYEVLRILAGLPAEARGASVGGISLMVKHEPSKFELPVQFRHPAKIKRSCSTCTQT